MTVVAPPALAPEFSDSMGALLRRLELTGDDEPGLRTALILAYEVLRERQAFEEATNGCLTRAEPTVAATAASIDDYAAVIANVHDAVHRCVRAGSRLLVVSRGDDALLVHGFDSVHFPQAPGGGYAGHYPSDSATAIAHLDECVGAEPAFLVVPSTGFWWLDFYPDFARRLLSRGRVRNHDGYCLIFELTPRPQGEVDKW
jgi:hypothetical protein